MKPSVADLRSLPRRVSRARMRAIGSTRRTCVALLTRAARVPGARPLVEPGMRLLFDTFAADWERIRADPTYRAGFGQALEHLSRDPQPARALDVGCGTGIASSMLLDRWPTIDVVGIDISPRMVALAQELVPGARFQVASVHELPFGDGEFDLVVALDGLIDADELLRVLEPTGTLLLVYSRGGTTPISRPITELAAAFTELGAIGEPHVDGEAHALVVRRAP